ncbi:hypothetical protein O1611_g6886 [Lasiodiplodia mahajangana]|uniref:Uncharacterized protein n=1 Tax=Lasiodiplodia mahajangana TaxID=1108764 RepID=A0ACC2JH49_9PEZI|nr:hypothetical protein O1611_g6886 [Lasiodiplodia mahajangana]
MSQDLDAMFGMHGPDLGPFEEICKNIHNHPEPDTFEERVACVASKHLQDLGFDVTTDIGGYGVVGILRNGDGPTLMLYADMDALPILENTGVSSASETVSNDAGGTERPVMHACLRTRHTRPSSTLVNYTIKLGDKMTLSVLVMAVASLLKHAAKAGKWLGTLTCVFQPNEGNGTGAKAMVERGLYNHTPKPDIVLAQHIDYCGNGNIAIRAGPRASAADSFLVTVHGKGGHASKLGSCIDPIMGCDMVVWLRSIVSRLAALQDEVILTCGSFHGGDAHDNIPDFVKFKVDIRTYNEKARAKVLKTMHDTMDAKAQASDAPKLPTIERTHEYPLTSHDPKLTEGDQSVFIGHSGESGVEEMEGLAGSQDFPNLELPHNTPYVIWFWGPAGAKEGTLDHSAESCPSIMATLQVGVRAMSMAALSYLTRNL